MRKKSFFLQSWDQQPCWLAKRIPQQFDGALHRFEALVFDYTVACKTRGRRLCQGTATRWQWYAIPNRQSTNVSGFQSLISLSLTNAFSEYNCKWHIFKRIQFKMFTVKSCQMTSKQRFRRKSPRLPVTIRNWSCALCRTIKPIGMQRSKSGATWTLVGNITEFV